MGKFNSTDGQTFVRTIDDVVQDYARALLEKKVITEDQFFYFISDGKNELLDVLFEKLYETEKHRGIEVSTLDAFYHYCAFILKTYQGQIIWNSFVKKAFLAIERNKNSAFMASRQLGKSFFLYVLYTSFKMFLYPGTQILAVSNIPMQCIENLRILKEIIDKYEVLFQKKEIELGKELKWTERQIQYNGGMFITLSAGTSPKGLSVHYVIIDDMITEGCQLNDEEAINYVLGQLYPTVQRKKGRMILSGTPLHRKDLYHYLMGNKTDFEGEPISNGEKSWKGFYSQMFPIASYDDESYYPDIYTTEEIFGADGIKETQGDIKFAREYMLNCIDESMTVFSEHLISSVSDGQEKYYYSPNDKEETFIIGVDVATSGAASADFSAFVVLGLKNTSTGQKKVIRHVIHEKGMPISEQISTIAELANRFLNAVVIVEKNNVGVALIQELARMNVNVEEYITDRPKKDGWIRYLVNEMKNKNLWFPEETTEITKIKRELVNFGVKRNKAGKERMEALTGHDDMVMALAMANQAAQDTGSLPFAVLQ